VKAQCEGTASKARRKIGINWKAIANEWETVGLEKPKIKLEIPGHRRLPHSRKVNQKLVDRARIRHILGIYQFLTGDAERC
jgi:hypothetical protein